MEGHNFIQADSNKSIVRTVCSTLLGRFNGRKQPGGDELCRFKAVWDPDQQEVWLTTTGIIIYADIAVRLKSSEEASDVLDRLRSSGFGEGGSFPVSCFLLVAL